MEELEVLDPALYGGLVEFTNADTWTFGGCRFDQFKYSFDGRSYNWSDREFLKKNRGQFAGVPVPLTKGYFMLVSPRNYKRMTQFPDRYKKKWHVLIGRDKEGNILYMYARRRGRKAYGEPKTVYAHRELLGRLMDGFGDGDHINGLGLDNRLGTPDKPVNLKLVSHRENGSNQACERTRHPELLRGVEKRGKNSCGVQLYGGVRTVRVYGSRFKKIRSRRRWSSQAHAARWYQNQLKKLYKNRTTWAHDSNTVHYPIFPPLKKETPTNKSRDTIGMEEEIPF